MKKLLFISVILILSISCSKKKEEVTPAPVTPVNPSAKFVGTFDVQDTGYYSWKMLSGSVYGCISPMIIDRHHTSVITEVTDKSFNISNFFGDGYDVVCGTRSPETTFETSDLNIKNNSGTCGQYIMGGSTRPHGYISVTGDTIIITYRYDEIMPGGGDYIHYINDFTSTFIRK